MAGEDRDDIMAGGLQSLAMRLAGVQEGTEDGGLVTEVYMPLARDIILRARNPLAPDPTAVEWEGRYDVLMCEIAADLYNRRGAEGEITHNENGVNRSWGSAGVSKHLMSRIIPRAKVPGL